MDHCKHCGGCRSLTGCMGHEWRLCCCAVEGQRRLVSYENGMIRILDMPEGNEP